MGSLKIYPSKLSGDVKIPPSKSMAHRAVICSSLSNGKSRISNIDFSDDIIATIRAMTSLGAIIEKKEDILEISGIFSKEGILNRENQLNQPKLTIDCNESGSTLRFLVPISLAFDGVKRFIGRGNLGKRPLDTYYEIFDRQNIKYSYKENQLDLIISGKLKPDEFRVKGNISSQFITGLLFILPTLESDSKIIITTELESKGYLDLTLSTIKDFGVEIINNNYKEFIIKGNQTYKARDYKVEGDYSQGAFYLSADAIGEDISILDLKEDSLQGDSEVVEILSRMGMEILREGNKIKGITNGLNGTLIDASQCPDIIPVLSVVASLSIGKTTIINAGRLRIKECDRLHAIMLS
ncbi:3-phosphoshikimate 1-carboxyvinyltransferase [Clostridioides difficile]|uniref:3-phosphoshikimate 1-carboxyvinyltransferase n=1 Tax=Clostridioides difficile TaxID=1496 RepID=UPI00038CF3A0|nr:3-phosphoshikimate 1-carboxyvinyltransferase [Clostridioides difficile]EQI69259.1 EPSP synthase family protein [Clostridioides difficile Y358]